MGSKADLHVCRLERARLRQATGTSIMALAGMVESYDTLVGPQSPMPRNGREAIQHFFRTSIEPARQVIEAAGLIEVDWREAFELTPAELPEPSRESEDLWPRLMESLKGFGAHPAGALMLEAMRRKSDGTWVDCGSADPMYAALSTTLDGVYAVFVGSVRNPDESAFWGACFSQQARYAAALARRILLRRLTGDCPPEAAILDPADFEVCDRCTDPDWCARACECRIAIVEAAQEEAFRDVDAAEDLIALGIQPKAKVEVDAAGEVLLDPTEDDAEGDNPFVEGDRVIGDGEEEGTFIGTVQAPSVLTKEGEVLVKWDREYYDANSGGHIVPADGHIVPADLLKRFEG